MTFNDPLETYLLPATHAIESDGSLSIGGMKVLDIVQQFGTPLFIYDEAHIRSRILEAKESFGSGVAYASKAFWCLAMARIVAELGISVDVSTAGECYVALKGGVDPSKIVFHGNNKSDEEIAMALDEKVGRIVIDSFDEIERLKSTFNPSHKSTFLLRVNPGIEAHTHEYIKTGQTDSKFGLGIQSGDATRAIEQIKKTDLPLVGIHAHIGSQIFDVSSFTKAAQGVGEFFKPLELDELCIGGGLGVAYVNGEPNLSFAVLADAIKEGLEEAGVPNGTKISIEPGRSLVATSAITCYRVGTIKQLPGVRTYLSVDGGMSDNPRPILYGSGYEAFLPRAVSALRPQVVRIVGKHCESGDVVVNDAALPQDTKVGDIVATPVTGAYGYSMASNYNKVPRPAVIFVRDGKAQIAIRRESFEDLVRLDS